MKDRIIGLHVYLPPLAICLLALVIAWQPVHLVGVACQTWLTNRRVAKWQAAEQPDAKAEASKEKPIQGRVVAVGPGKPMDNGKLAKPSVRKGDTVVYSKYAGNEVEIKGESHLIVRESELLGVIEG